MNEVASRLPWVAYAAVLVLALVFWRADVVSARASTTWQDFADCLAATGVHVRPSAGGRRLGLPNAFPSVAALSRSLRSCRHYAPLLSKAVTGPNLVSLHKAAVAYRACMRRHGWERGVPVVFLVFRGDGVFFPTRTSLRPDADANADSVCGKLFPNRGTVTGP